MAFFRLCLIFSNIHYMVIIFIFRVFFLINVVQVCVYCNIHHHYCCCSCCLASNQLVTLPAEIGQLEHLTILELQDNAIVSLPQEMEALSNLVRLNLCRNKMTELPDCICHLKDLKVSLPFFVGVFRVFITY